MAYYLDTSALVKLVVVERESEALRSWIQASDSKLVSCDLVRTELIRAVRRADPEQVVRARAVLDLLELTEVTAANFDSAGRLDPVFLRTLDALHLAAALDLGDDLEGIVTYDDRLAEAAAHNGISVHAPT